MSCCVDVYNFLCSIESACYEPFSMVNELLFNNLDSALKLDIAKNIRANGSTGKRSLQFLWICWMRNGRNALVKSVFKWISFCGMREKKNNLVGRKYNKYRTKCGTNVVWNFTIVGNSIYSHRNIIRLPFFAFFFEI